MYICKLQCNLVDVLLRQRAMSHVTCHHRVASQQEVLEIGLLSARLGFHQNYEDLSIVSQDFDCHTCHQQLYQGLHSRLEGCIPATGTIAYWPGTVMMLLDVLIPGEQHTIYHSARTQFSQLQSVTLVQRFVLDVEF